MNMKYWRAAILAGIIVWVWTGISWKILPWHQAATKQFRNETEVAQVIKENATTKGVYRLPGFFVDKGIGHGGMSDIKEYFKRGPYFFGAVQPEGRDISYPMMHFLSLMCDILAAFIVCWLILKAKGLSFWNQVGLAMLVGLFAGIVLCRNEWVWGGYSLGFAMVSVMDLLIGWFFGGIVIAKTLKSKP